MLPAGTSGQAAEGAGQRQAAEGGWQHRPWAPPPASGGHSPCGGQPPAWTFVPVVSVSSMPLTWARKGIGLGEMARFVWVLPAVSPLVTAEVTPGARPVYVKSLSDRIHIISQGSPTLVAGHPHATPPAPHSGDRGLCAAAPQSNDGGCGDGNERGTGTCAELVSRGGRRRERRRRQWRQ